MIPVKLQLEPKDFDRKIRNKGAQFLRDKEISSSRDWKNREYWQEALPDMRESYKHVCSYCAQWIPHGTGRHSIDHFIPKTEQPELAYEWTNFRYVSARFNSRKGTRDILDPFELQVDSFFINFTSFFIHPNTNLSVVRLEKAKKTIEYLKLNSDDNLVNERKEYFLLYRNNDISFNHLLTRAPFIAYEVERQKMRLVA